METNKSRKRWKKDEPVVQMPINAPAVKEEIFPHHEEYLLLLQEKNRLLKKLRKKSQKDIRIERKEQGFALYVNGANADRDVPLVPSPGKSIGKGRLPRTAGETRNKVYLNAADLAAAEKDMRQKQEERRRAKTAPEKTRRKGWNVGSVDITTASGDKRKLKAPDIMTGNYDDDFEMDESGDYYSSDDDIEQDCNSNSRPSSSNSRPGSARKTSYLKRKAAQLRQEEEDSDRLMLSLADVRKLRQSLQMNASIRQSMAMEVSSDEEIDVGSTIDEEEEEIEEDFSPEGSSIDSPTSPLCNMMKPTETIVLEFAPLPSKNKVERNLSAARKGDDSDASSKRPSSRSLPSPRAITPSSTPKDVHMKSTPSAKKSAQSLAQSSRKGNNPCTDSREEATAVMKALQAENEKLKNSRKSPRPETLQKAQPSSDGPNVSKSRLSARSPVSKLTPFSSPSKLSQELENLSAEKVTDIVSKVLAMPPKQQRKLVRMLGRIDDSSGSGPAQLSPVSSSKPIKATLPVSQMTSKQKSGALSCDLLEINMEVLSNWGHPDRVGLTEIQFISTDGKLIPVQASDVSVHGATGCKNSLDILFNGKAKTTKERNMWSCEYEDGLSMEFVIVLRNPTPNKPFNLSTIKVWNFNKSLNELSIGARHTRIFVGGELVFDGDIEKGCGNQAFDYCQVIDLSSSRKDNPISKHFTKGDNSTRPSGSHSSPSPSVDNSAKNNKHVRSETRTLHRSSKDLNRPHVGSDRSQSSPENEEDDVKMPEKGRSKTPRKANRLAARLPGHSSDTDASRSVSDSLDPKVPLAPIKTSTSKSPVSPRPKSLAPLGNDRSANSRSPRRATSQKEGQRSDEDDAPIVQKLKEMNINDQRRKKEVPTWLNPEDAQDERRSPQLSRGGQAERKSPSPRPMYSKTEKSRQDDNEALVVEELGSWPQAGLDHLNTTLDRPTGSPSAAEKAEAGDEVSPMLRIQSNRSKWRTAHENLEEEWGSLSLFNRQQRGRLSIDMGDDSLDQYLTGVKKEPSGPAGPEEVAQDECEQDDFVIPELPFGKELIMNIRTTWGDKHYVGLTGIDIFSSTGEPVIIKQIYAKPKDINELPEYHKDPRVVTNIIDGVNRTRDDVHMWLAPFTPGADHKVFMAFEKPCKIAMIRIWNYNKSRIHSYRGAKDLVLTLDKQVVFKGEIARACGGVEGGTEAFGDTILFTVDEDILEEVSKNDDAYEGDMFSDEEEDVPFDRPSTADNDERPFTRAAGVHLKPDPTPRPGTSMVTYAGDILVYKTKKLELDFIATWGDMHYLGLTGIEIAGKDGEPLSLRMSMLSANPRDLHSLPGHDRDDRTLDKLIDGNNITLSDEHMWLIPFTPGQSHTLTISFDQQVMVSAIRIWNYNKTAEDTYRGAKLMHIRINGKQISPEGGFLIRKGPGNCHFDFAQEISLSSSHKPQNSYPHSSSNPGVDSSISYEVVHMPCGFIYQLQLFTTWGDQYYVGLNGIEVYDSCFNLIELTDNNISAFPESCNVLDNIHNDVRTPDKLIDGINDSVDGKHMWLAPILPSIVNRVYIIFDQPTTISMLKLWNYSKTPSRGTKDFALLVDDLLVYNGALPSVTTAARGILPTCSGPQSYHTVLFTDNKEILKREKNTAISNQAEDQDVQLLNDKQIVSKYTNPKSAQSGKPVNQALRPKTSVPLKKR